MQITSKPFRRTARAVVQRATPQTVQAHLTREDVHHATWAAFLASDPDAPTMSWLPQPPVELIPVGEVADSDFGAFVEAAGATA